MQCSFPCPVRGTAVAALGYVRGDEGPSGLRGVRRASGADGRLRAAEEKRPFRDGKRRAAAAAMNRERGGRALATWLKKRLSFDRWKREPLSVRGSVAA